MPFWRKETDEEKQANARQKETMQALERGEIPPVARQRIMREQAYGKKFFASDLSSREFLLAREAGLQTIGQVMGTSFFKIGFFGSFNSYELRTRELSQITQTLMDARTVAVDRMRQEAQLLGASGVIGVKVKAKRHAWSSNITEFTAFGSAIRIPDWPAEEGPFTSSLNGQEFWQLYKAGYLPLSIVMGACAYYMHMDDYTRQALYGWFSPNQEVDNYTHGFNLAAAKANARMLAELDSLKADGAVGITVDPGMETIEYELNNMKYTDILLNYVVLGTAVSAHPEKEQKHAAPLLCLDLASGKYRGLGRSAEAYGNYSDIAAEALIDE